MVLGLQVPLESCLSSGDEIPFLFPTGISGCVYADEKKLMDHVKKKKKRHMWGGGEGMQSSALEVRRSCNRTVS